MALDCCIIVSAPAILYRQYQICLLQNNTGHYSSSFTMDTYAAVSDTMKQDTRNRLEQYIQQVSNL